MKFFADFFWILKSIPNDNAALDITEIKTPSPTKPNQTITHSTGSHVIDNSNIINLFDYVKLRKHAY